MKWKFIIIFLCILVLIVGGLFYMNSPQIVTNVINQVLGKGMISAMGDNEQSGIVLSPNVFGGWSYYMTGNESVLYNVKSLTDKQVCIIPKEITLNPITKEEDDLSKSITDKEGMTTYEKKNVTYYYPTSINMYDLSQTAKTIVDTKSLTTQKEKDNSICFDIDSSKSLLYKLGEESIIISGASDYASTNTNVTQENLFTHLNMSDAGLVLYMPFDVVQDSANKTYDYSNYSNDGLISSATFDLTGGIYGGSYRIGATSGMINDSIKMSSTAGTITFWVKTEKNSSQVGSFYFYDTDGANRYLMYKSSSNVFYIFVGGTQLSPTINNLTFSSNDFFMLTIAWDTLADKTYLYKNITLINIFNTAIGVGTSGNLIIGNRYSNNNGLNGSIDEVMIFNRTLSDYEVGQIYNATLPKFYPLGTMNFTANNFGTNNTLNITILNCQQLNGSIINFKINSGSYAQLNSSCMYDSYAMTGDLTSASLVLQLNSTTSNFYSPVIAGNIVLDSWGVIEEPISCASGSSAEWYIPNGCTCYYQGDEIAFDVDAFSCVID